MKNTIKITLALALILGFSLNGYSQRNTKKSTQPEKNKTVVAKKTVVTKTVVPRKNVEYKTTRKKVVTVRTLPKTATVVKHNNVSLYYDNSRFYRLNGGRYVPAQPNVGFQIRTLPVGYKTFNHRGLNYFLNNGIYFVKVNNYYEVVNPEIGTVVYELPAEAERVSLSGRALYEFNNVLYERIQTRGTRAYEVVGFIEG
ncbi:DUF6515 family protein [Arcticibacterium luteifluviistationis]|uniref:Uncharacterized protein n=1 Tax=Arcticibacterium luteifluviistationis TaxID=1784714 RepID=A0A2Z4GAH0_9BACT|nr:DUF6515 family protein [Arcticibacterium luteifluviistationis]AWV98259.1 hypothetical protein DJ013_08790 [Arcticibacterium luteifluviistationis]